MIQFISAIKCGLGLHNWVCVDHSDRQYIAYGDKCCECGQWSENSVRVLREDDPEDTENPYSFR